MVGSTREAVARGASLFDAGAWFEAHEVWEDRWRQATDPSERLALQGLIQIAASYHKLIVMRSPQSAVRLATRGLAKLEACPSAFHDLDLVRWRADVRASLATFTAGDFDPRSIPRLTMR